MKAATRKKRAVPGVECRVDDIIRRQVQVWCGRLDHLLDLHRSKFAGRQVTERKLKDHQVALGLAIRFTQLMNDLIADSVFNDPDLVFDLTVRARQLRDALETLNAAEPSDKRSADALQKVFVE
jgi:hypothetical protein